MGIVVEEISNKKVKLDKENDTFFIFKIAKFNLK